ncbi:formyl transferase, partial [Methylobacterium sp. WL122]
MRLRLRLDGRRPRLWQAQLLRRVAGLPGVEAIEIDDRPGSDVWPANADLLFSLESLIHRLPRSGASAPADLSAWPQAGRARPDLILDLCGDVESEAADAIWRLTFDGCAGEAGLLASLLDGRAPGIAFSDGSRVVASGRTGTERRGVMLTSFDDALFRTVSLLSAAVAGRRE